MVRVTDLSAYVAPAHFVDSDHPDVIEWAREHGGSSRDPRDRAVALFYAVRDGLRYDAYNTSADPADYRASVIVQQPAGWCVSKSVMLTAAARAAGIPARLGFADVRNHLSTPKLIEQMGTDVFAWHGYTEFWLDDRWIKASSAFNIEMCERFGTKALEWDGVHDALMHPFDQAGNKHMEYIAQRGSFVDLPLDEIFATFREIYPSWFERLETTDVTPAAAAS